MRHPVDSFRYARLGKIEGREERVAGWGNDSTKGRRGEGVG